MHPNTRKRMAASAGVCHPKAAGWKRVSGAVNTHSHVALYHGPCPKRGEGFNDFLYRLACQAAAMGACPLDTERQLTAVFGQLAKPGEIRRQVRRAFGWVRNGEKHSPGPKFPKRDAERITQLVRYTPRTVADLIQASPVLPPTGDPLGILRQLMRLEEEELIYLGPSPTTAGDTRSLGEWHSFDIRRFEMVVPNPMRARRGLTVDGKDSPRCNGNACLPDEMRLCVIEPDITEDLAAACGVSPADVCAAILLEKVFPLLPPRRIRAVVDSGNRSLHLWLDITGASRERVIALFRELTPFGIDPAGLRPAQQFRLPGGLRTQTGRTQSVLYWNP